MNKKILYFFASILILSTTSCLNQEPISEIDKTKFFKNDREVNAGVIACYYGLAAPMKNEWQLTELRTDNSRVSTYTSLAGPITEMYQLDLNAVNPFLNVIGSYWDDTYFNIENCNTVLANLDVVSNAKAKSQYEGEARFIRAYHYFNLVRLFGPTFLVEETLTPKQALDMSRSTEEEVYALIKEDLTIAADTLPVSYIEESKGRVTKSVAKTLLAKVYLTLGDHAKAKQLLIEVEADPNYDLLGSYKDIFALNNELNKELLFVARFKTGNMGLGGSFSNDFAPSGAADLILGSGKGYNSPTLSVIGSYSSKLDERKETSLRELWTSNAGKKTYTPWCYKYFSQPGSRDDAENDWPILRYADVLLMLAEIYNEEGDRGTALSYINQIRTRAKAPVLVATDVDTKVKCALAIEKERQIEFLFENHRFFDLVRTKRFVEVMKNHYDTELINETSNPSALSLLYKDPLKIAIYRPSSIVQKWQLLLPIPASVMNTAPNATQNPNY